MVELKNEDLSEEQIKNLEKEKIFITRTKFLDNGEGE